jgi:hypothetical protein
VSAEITYTAAVIISLRYLLQIDDSNSFGHSFLRHRVEASLTVELPAQIYASLRAVLTLNEFPDGIFLGEVGSFVTVEDEARNALFVHIQRDIGNKVAAEARYAFYADAFGQAQALPYQRHTFTLGLVYTP